MRGKLEPLSRLKTLYETVEGIHAAELQRAAAALHEAQSAMDAEIGVAASARNDGRAALWLGDRVGWAAAEVRRWSSGRKRQRLEMIRSERERANEAANEQYLASRVKTEQMQRLSTSVAEQIAVAEEKKMQAATDDRFLARKNWKNKHEERRGAQRMKAS